MEYGNKCDGTAMGHNAGTGNRAVASHIKALHNGAGKSGNSVSALMKPTRSGKPPGAPASVLKTPRRSDNISSAQRS